MCMNSCGFDYVLYLVFLKYWNGVNQESELWLFGDNCDDACAWNDLVNIKRNWWTK